MASPEAVASSSSTATTASIASVSSCWNPLSVQAAYDMAVYNLLAYNGLFYDPNLHSMYHSAEAASRPVKRRKIEVSNPVQEQQQQAVTNTRLSFDPRSRGRVGWKPYSDIRLDQHGSPLASGGRLVRKGEDPRPLKTLGKRRHGDSSNHGSTPNVVKNTQVIQPCLIGNLFPEILSMIFEYLDVQSKGRVAQVSCRWRDAAYKKSVWKGMTAMLHLNRSNPTLFSSLATKGIKHVQVLSLRRNYRELVQGVPNIKSLNLSGCYSLSDANLDLTFSKEVLSLTSLNLSLCKELSDSSLTRIALKCPNLENIDLAGCSKITNGGLRFLSWNLSKLKTLNLRSCRQVSDAGIANLCGMDDLPNPASLSLQSLSLQDCQKLSDDSLRYISQKMPNLKSINLSFCVSVTDTGLKSLAKIASLEEINLRSCDNVSDIGIGFLAEDHGKLKSLDISFCGNVSDGSLRHMASAPGLNSSLKKLAMTTCAITDEGMVKLAKNLGQLQELHIGQCVKLSDLSLEAMGTSMKELTSVDLYGCPKLSEAGLQKMKKQLTKLKLNLSL